MSTTPCSCSPVPAAPARSTPSADASAAGRPRLPPAGVSRRSGRCRRGSAGSRPWWSGRGTACRGRCGEPPHVGGATWSVPATVDKPCTTSSSVCNDALFVFCGDVWNEAVMTRASFLKWLIGSVAAIFVAGIMYPVLRFLKPLSGPMWTTWPIAPEIAAGRFRNQSTGYMIPATKIAATLPISHFRKLALVITASFHTSSQDTKSASLQTLLLVVHGLSTVAARAVGHGGRVEVQLAGDAAVNRRTSACLL